mmetsp:Transcript_13273/g.17359  ORF Transcript_13273/g.17359 Transcript_13273/m.17359 type:complete len:351 (-) Transcript_13273:27-1079(-)
MDANNAALGDGSDNTEEFYLYDGGELSLTARNNLRRVKVDESVTEIPSHAFQGCIELIKVQLPNTVTSIGRHSFFRCKSLENINLPESLVTIGEGAFAISGIQTVNLPLSVTNIGEGCFYKCKNLSSVHFPPRVSELRALVCSGCKRLETVTLARGVTSIARHAFAWCSKLTSVCISNTVERIGIGAFRACWSLVEISIPDSVRLIGDGAFYRCANLMTVRLSQNEDLALGDGVLDSCHSLTRAEPPRLPSNVWHQLRLEVNRDNNQVFNGDIGICESGTRNLITTSIPVELWPRLLKQLTSTRRQDFFICCEAVKSIQFTLLRENIGQLLENRVIENRRGLRRKGQSDV